MAHHLKHQKPVRQEADHRQVPDEQQPQQEMLPDLKEIAATASGELPPTPSRILQLQRLIGNAAVQRLLAHSMSNDPVPPPHIVQLKITAAEEQEQDEMTGEEQFDQIGSQIASPPEAPNDPNPNSDANSARNTGIPVAESLAIGARFGRTALIQRDVGTPDELSSGERWYLEATPSTSIIPQNTPITFELKNTRRGDLSAYAVGDPGDHLRAPIAHIVWTDNTGERFHRIEDAGTSTGYSPFSFTYTFRNPGRRQVRMRFKEYTTNQPVGSHGVPDLDAGPPSRTRGTGARGAQNWAQVSDYGPYELTYDFYVARGLPTQDDLQAEQSAAVHDEDQRAIQDGDLSNAELVQYFRRIAIRRALERLTRNKEEALRLKGLYEDADQPQTQRRTEIIRHFYTVYQGLEDQNTAAGRRIWYLAREIRPRQGIQSFTGDRSRPLDHPEIRDDPRVRPLVRQIRQNNEAQTMITASYPELHAVMRQRTGSRDMDNDATRQAVLDALQQVTTAIDQTRRALTTDSDDLDIMDCTPIVQPTLNELTPTNPRIQTAVQASLDAAAGRQILEGLALATVNVGLLFIPYVGPALAAAIDVAVAADSIEHAWAMRAAARAGVSEGVVSDDDAEAAQMAAAIDTILAAVSVVGAVADSLQVLRGLRRGVRVPRSTATSTPDGPSGGNIRTIPAAPTGGPARSLPPRTLSYDEAMEAFEDAFLELPDGIRRRARPDPSVYRVHPNPDAFEDAWRAASGDLMGDVPQGFFNPADGLIHLPHRSNPTVVVHEVLHWGTHQGGGRAIMGDFFEEGFVDITARRISGPHPAHGSIYEPNVAFVREVEAALGSNGSVILRNAMLDGSWNTFNTTMRGHFRALGDAGAFDDFMMMLRGISRHGESVEIDRLLRMLNGELNIGTNPNIVLPGSGTP